MMISKLRAPHIHAPRSLNDATTLYSKHPDAVLYAGGTRLLMSQTGKFLDLPRLIISLRNIEELQRITRTERYLEIGSMVTLNQLLSTGKNVLPSALIEGISHVGNPALRNLATIGGNLASKGRRMTLYPILHVMDARVELRSGSGSRWVAVSRFQNQEGKLSFKAGELITRIRLPFTQWDIQFYSEPVSLHREEDISLIFCGLANTQKDFLSDFRFIFSFSGRTLIRQRELEAELVGRKLPLSRKETAPFVEAFRTVITAQGETLSRFQTEQSIHFLSKFLQSLSTE